MTRIPARSALRRVLTNVAFISGTNLLGRILNLVLHAALGRLFGPAGLGEYSTAVAVAGYFIFTADFGLSPRLVREGAVAPDALADEYARALGFKFGIGALSVLVLFALTLILPYDEHVIEMILLLGLGSIVRSFSYLSESVCRARERLDLEGAAAFVNSGLYVGVTLILFYLGYSIRVVGWVYLGAASAQLVASLWFASRFIPIRASLPPWRELGSAALPYATTSLTMLAFAQIDVLILSVIESPEFVGSYAAVSRLLLVAGTLGALASAGVLPTAARFYAHAERQRFDLLVNEALRGALLVGGAAALGLAFIARSVVGEIYGDQFVDLYPLLRAGSIYLALSFAASILATMLTSIGRQGDRARSILISLASTVVLVLGLTPYFGLAGTVTAMVGSEFVLVGCLAWCLRSRLRWPSLTRTAVVLLTSGALATALHFALLEGDTWLNLAVATIVPLSAYVGLVFVGGEGRRAIRFIMTLRRGDTALG